MFGWPCYQIGSIASRQRSESTHINPTGVRPSASRVRGFHIFLSWLCYYIDSDKLCMLVSCSIGYFANCKVKCINFCCNYSSVRLACWHAKSTGWSRHSVITVLIPAYISLMGTSNCARRGMDVYTKYESLIPAHSTLASCVNWPLLSCETKGWYLKCTGPWSIIRWSLCVYLVAI